MASNPAPVAAGNWTGMMSCEKRSRACPTTRSKSAFSLSSLDTTKSDGTRMSRVYPQTISVPTSAPSAAFRKIIAVSETRRLDFTSPVKSVYPGVSRMLTLYPCHSLEMSAELMEICRSISSGW
jgi:hypothetical protein